MKKTEELILLEKSERIVHLNLDDTCWERGGNSTVHQGVLAQFLETDIPFKRKLKVYLCHACHNDKCSNPRHLYWGTQKENMRDCKASGKFKSGWDNMVAKLGYKGALEWIRKSCRRERRGFKNGHIPWNKGKLSPHKMMWITDENKTTRIMIGCPIPLGWRRGRAL